MRKENHSLHQQLLLAQGKGALSGGLELSSDLKRCVFPGSQNVTLPNDCRLQQENKVLRQDVENMEKSQKRLMQVCQNKISEFRETMCKLFGFKISYYEEQYPSPPSFSPDFRHIFLNTTNTKETLPLDIGVFSEGNRSTHLPFHQTREGLDIRTTGNRIFKHIRRRY